MTILEPPSEIRSGNPDHLAAGTRRSFGSSVRKSARSSLTSDGTQSVVLLELPSDQSLQVGGGLDQVAERREAARPRVGESPLRVEHIEVGELVVLVPIVGLVKRLLRGREDLVLVAPYRFLRARVVLEDLGQFAQDLIAGGGDAEFRWAACALPILAKSRS